MKHLFPILLFVLTGCSSEAGQSSDEVTEDSTIELEAISGLNELNEILLDDIDENSSEEDMSTFGIVDVVEDGLNYLPTMTLETGVKMTTPEIAYVQLLKLKPNLEGMIKCWGKYKGFFIFSLDEEENPTICHFLSIYYVKEGASEFWYFYPNT
ncbi:MAG: hypothetical protein ACI857_000599 [Arenicella sp.]|jgi:hypothetical protein